jgi:hypothetical protein
MAPGQLSDSLTPILLDDIRETPASQASIPPETTLDLIAHRACSPRTGGHGLLFDSRAGIDNSGRDRGNCMRITIALLFVPLLAVAAQDRDPAKLYTVHCAQCHEHDIRAPSRAALSKLSPAMISTALETGSMRNVGSQLTTDETNK